MDLPKRRAALEAMPKEKREALCEALPREAGEEDEEEVGQLDMARFEARRATLECLSPGEAAEVLAGLPPGEAARLLLQMGEERAGPAMHFVSGCVGLSAGAIWRRDLRIRRCLRCAPRQDRQAHGEHRVSEEVVHLTRASRFRRFRFAG